MLQQRGIEHEVLLYPESLKNAREVARSIDLPPCEVYKTLVARGVKATNESVTGTCRERPGVGIAHVGAHSKSEARSHADPTRSGADDRSTSRRDERARPLSKTLACFFSIPLQQNRNIS